MRFERGKDIKTTLDIGIPEYEIYRMLIFEDKQPDNIGFYIMQFNQTLDTLEKISNGELNRSKYILEFNRKYDSLEGRLEIPLYEMSTCFIVYQAEKFLIKSHHDELQER